MRAQVEARDPLSLPAMLEAVEAVDEDDPNTCACGEPKLPGMNVCNEGCF
jgi:hypothetical protein